MKWIEWIQLRSAGLAGATPEPITGLKAVSDDVPGLMSVEIFSRVRVDSEIAILLRWETEAPQTEGSLLGLQLSRELKRSGWVSHAIWIEPRNLS